MTSSSDIRAKLGLVHVYTGNGKGKTTAALGLALRAMGNDLNVAMVQFMKCDQYYGEYQISKELQHLTLLPMGRDCLICEENVSQADIDAAAAALNKSRELMHSGKYDMVIMDEVNVSMKFGLVRVEDVVKVLKERPPHVEVVLTGRYAPEDIIELADLVTEMRCLKHPYTKGIQARAGIER
ncbi:MAG: cob(I)yrinic acid a,c-diamide adenosyltransferase [Methanomassiliicoccus sp.]|nr:cob(I)yrinic acid a,c-diamide adenosyltransferase [Methanomassiliicoccus sp.]